MDQNEIEKPRDEPFVEITDLDTASDNKLSSSSPWAFAQSWLLSPRYRRWRMIATGTLVGLVIIAIVFSTPSIHQLFMRASPTPVPSTYLFGLDANPPWGNLSIDGKSVAMTSTGDYMLFSLPRGRHTLIWRAPPFSPQQCVLSVPIDAETTLAPCQFPTNAPNLPGQVSAYISFPTNLSLLSADHRTALLNAAQTIFDNQQSSEIVQVGQLYTQTSETAGSGTRSCSVVLQRAAVCFTAAHSPLKATLRLQLDTGTSPADPCSAGVCDSGSQYCRLFCDISSYAGFGRTLPRSVWQASVSVRLLWQFTTRNGVTVEERQANSFILGQQNASSVPLNITWNGKQWNVTPASQNASFENASPVCQAALGDMYTLVFASNPLYAEPQPIAGPTPAWGCLLKIPMSSDPNGALTPTATPSTVAYVIQRFGVLLAANATAHRLWPFLPMADAYTRQLAQQLLTTGQRSSAFISRECWCD